MSCSINVYFVDHYIVSVCDMVTDSSLKLITHVAEQFSLHSLFPGLNWILKMSNAQTILLKKFKRSQKRTLQEKSKRF